MLQHEHSNAWAMGPSYCIPNMKPLLLLRHASRTACTAGEQLDQQASCHSRGPSHSERLLTAPLGRQLLKHAGQRRLCQSCIKAPGIKVHVQRGSGQPQIATSDLAVALQAIKPPCMDTTVACS